MTIHLKQSTASQEVALGYFLDSTDGNSEETGLTIANTDIKLHKAGATTLANKNSGGATHISNGIYYAVLDATDTDTLGPLVIFVHVTGSLPVRLECCVLAANVYDALIGGGDLLQVDVSQFGNAAGTFASGRPEVNTTHAAGTAWNSGAIGAATLASDTITAAKIAADAIGASELAADAITEIQSGLATASALSTVAGYVDTEVAAIKAVTDKLDTLLENSSDGWIYTVAALQQAPVGTGDGGGLDAAGIRAAIGLASANLDAQLDALPTAAENATAVMGSTIEGTFDLTESARLWNAALAGKASGLSGTAATFRDLADTKDRIVATVDADGNRTAVTRDVT